MTSRWHQRRQMEQRFNNRVPDGVEVFGRNEVRDVKPDEGAAFIVEGTNDRYNEEREHRRRRHPGYNPYELKTIAGQELSAVARYIAKPALDSFGRETVLIDSDAGSRFARANKQATEKLDRLRSSGIPGFIIFAWGSNQYGEPEVKERTALIKKRVIDWDLPTIELEVVPPSSDVWDMAEAHDGIQRLLTEQGIVLPPLEDL